MSRNVIAAALKSSLMEEMDACTHLAQISVLLQNKRVNEMKGLLNKLFYFLNKSKITQWHSLYNLGDTIEIKISEYKKVTMSDYDISVLKYHLAQIQKIIN